MASTTSTYTSTTFATATAAAAATSKARPSPLNTPLSGTYPSALQSPSIGTPGYLRRDESLKTPLTPPSAYLDFLKSIPSALTSPVPSTGTSATFSFPVPGGPVRSPLPNRPDARPPAQPPTPARPPLSSHPSAESDVSNTTDSSTSKSVNSCPETVLANTSKPLAKTSSGSSQPYPPRPASATIPPRRPSVHIPSSAHSINQASPHSAIRSPGGSTTIRTPSSAKYKYAPWSSILSPKSATETTFDGDEPGKARPVSIRHVVTRTVTYSRPAQPKSAGGVLNSPIPKTEQEFSPSTDTPVKRELASDSTADELEGFASTTPTANSRKSPLVGEAPRGKRRKIDPGLKAESH